MLIENKKSKETWDRIIIPETVRGQALTGLLEYPPRRSGIGRTVLGAHTQGRTFWQSLAGWHRYLNAGISLEKSTLVNADDGCYWRKFRSNGGRN